MYSEDAKKCVYGIFGVYGSGGMNVCVNVCMSVCVCMCVYVCVCLGWPRKCRGDRKNPL